MTEALWLLPVLAAAGGVYLWRRQRAHRAEIADTLERSELHEAQVNALTSWLQDERICRAIIEHHLASRADLVAIMEGMDSYSEDNVRWLVARLLSSRDVRKVIAGHLEREMKIPRREAMAPLLQWARYEPAGEVSA